MRVEEVIARLKANAARLQGAGIAHVSVFGSVARGEQTPESDLDLLIELDPAQRIDLWDYAGIAGELQSLFSTPVGVANRAWLKPHIAQEILRDAVRAF